MPLTSIRDTFCFGFLPTPRNEKKDFFSGSGAGAGAAAFGAGDGGAALGGRGVAGAETGFAARVVFAAARLAGFAALAFAGFFALAALRGGAAFRPTVFFGYMIPPCASSITEMAAKS